MMGTPSTGFLFLTSPLLLGSSNILEGLTQSLRFSLGFSLLPSPAWCLEVGVLFSPSATLGPRSLFMWVQRPQILVFSYLPAPSHHSNSPSWVLCAKWFLPNLETSPNPSLSFLSLLNGPFLFYYILSILCHSFLI